MSVPLFVSVDTLSTPPAPPVPIWSVPPEFRLMVPWVPRESVPDTDTRPPVIVSVPVPLRPTVRLPLLAHVPLETAAIGPRAARHVGRADAAGVEAEIADRVGRVSASDHVKGGGPGCSDVEIAAEIRTRTDRRRAAVEGRVSTSG